MCECEWTCIEQLLVLIFYLVGDTVWVSCLLLCTLGCLLCELPGHLSLPPIIPW